MALLHVREAMLIDRASKKRSRAAEWSPAQFVLEKGLFLLHPKA
jgi:hypothetical protein